MIERFERIALQYEGDEELLLHWMKPGSFLISILRLLLIFMKIKNYLSINILLKRRMLISETNSV